MTQEAIQVLEEGSCPFMEVPTSLCCITAMLPLR